jgi:hypothetical protein
MGMRINSRLVALFGLVLGVQICAQAADPGPPGGLNVNVVNTPLPVQGTVSGTVSISGTPSVNVANTPNVNVANTPNVNVTNTVTTIDAANPASQPFQRAEVVSWNNPNLIGGDATFTVPAGKRLVIEVVSYSLFLPTGTRPTLNFIDVSTANSNQSPVSYYVPVSLQGNNGTEDVFTGNSLTRLYADPGSTVDVAVRSNSTSGLASVSVSGYLVNVQ